MDITKLKEVLINEKNNKVKGGLYHTSQVTFAYNSNKMEGSNLSEEETKAIFKTQSLVQSKKDKNVLDDIIETKNHFKLFDYMLDNIDEPLSKNMIIEMNKILKKDTSNEKNPKYNVGGFKTIPNMIGLVNVIKTSKPEDVSKDIDELLEYYNNKNKITLKDIIDFHVRFERIHPFGDGNGRVGRMIMFKECLKNNIMPFIILDNRKEFYIRGLQNYNIDSRYLIDTCLDASDIYENMCKILVSGNI